MKPFKLFAQITKIDVEKREVWGQAVQEVPDKSKEIFDFDSSKPLFEKWSGEIEKATDGKSLGNIRAMHGNVAAGKVIAMTCDDVEKAIDIGTKIVDDNEWQKVLEGVYTGFSIGGSYEKKWKDPTDPTLTRYTAAPVEISLVDNPCVPTARFTMVKADGAVEQLPFKAAEPAADPAPDAPPADAPAPGAPVPQADGAPAADADPAEDPIVAEATKAFLVAHQAELAAAIATAKAAKAAAAPVKKSIYSVSELADVLCSIRYLAEDAQWEASYEQDGSAMPAQLRDWLKQGVDILTAMTAEETAEMLAAVNPEPLILAATGDLTKRADDLQKVVADLTTERDTLKKKVEQLEAEPEAPKGVVKVVAKTDDDPAVAAVIELPAPTGPNDPNFAKAVMKAVHARGGVSIGPR